MFKRSEVWDGNGRANGLDEYLIHKMEEVNLCDAEPLKLTPTWRTTNLGRKVFPKG
jgi:hypothetical protein